MPEELAREGLAALVTRERLAATVDGLGNPRLIVTALESGWYMRNQLLRDADWAGMAHSVEIRTPLVDAELTRRIAPLLATDEPPGKRDMADAPRAKLPREVLERAKTGFVVPVREWVADGEAAPARGLRGWARQVHAAFGGFG
jgi:asparagine synthase (glutamine-hydrolysing)